MKPLWAEEQMRNTTGQLCTNAQAYLQQVAIREVEPLPAWLVEHAAQCAACRGAIALLTATLLTESSPLPLISCAECQADLAAYIDLELAEGLAAGLRAYLTVGWHLWSCPDCAELYRLTRALEEATRAAALSMPGAAALRRTLYTTRLSRAFLSHALPRMSPALGALRGQTRGSTVLIAEEEANHQVSFSVVQQPDTTWHMIMAVAPPVAGWLVLSLGDHSFRARFDARGHAIVYHVPATLLGAEAGPDLVATIELDETSTEHM